MNKKFIAIIFEIENQFQRVGYLSLIKSKHPESDVIVIAQSQLSALDGFIKYCYIISDYINYATKCVCSKISNNNVFYIVDECRRNITLMANKTLNKNVHDWALKRAPLQKPRCLHCKTLRNFTHQELALLSTINSLGINDEDLKDKVIYYLGINRKIYSRLLRSLLLRLGLKNEHSLIQWAHLKTPYNYQDGL